MRLPKFKYLISLLFSPIFFLVGIVLSIIIDQTYLVNIIIEVNKIYLIIHFLLSCLIISILINNKESYIVSFGKTKYQILAILFTTLPVLNMGNFFIHPYMQSIWEINNTSFFSLATAMALGFVIFAFIVSLIFILNKYVLKRKSNSVVNLL